MIRINQVLVSLLIFSCSPDKSQERPKEKVLINSVYNIDEESNIKAQETVIENRPLIDTFTFVGDSVILPAFEISLSLSKKTEEKLKGSNESIIISAEFSGKPIDTTTEEYQEWGEIHIGSHKIELFNSRIARFDNAKISKSSYELLKDKNFQVLINVFSGRRSSRDNLLNCDGLQEGIETVKGKRHHLKGKLIYGDE